MCVTFSLIRLSQYRALWTRVSTGIDMVGVTYSFLAVSGADLSEVVEALMSASSSAGAVSCLVSAATSSVCSVVALEAAGASFSVSVTFVFFSFQPSSSGLSFWGSLFWSFSWFSFLWAPV